MGYCEACEELRQNAPHFILNGIREIECESLQKNTGINPALGVLHDNCEDLNNINDCLIAALAETLPAVNICDIKEFTESLMMNIHTTNKALICSDCGQWTEIGKLWKRLQDLEKLVQALRGDNFLYLTEGVDYDLHMHNNITIDASGPLKIGIIESSGICSVHISCEGLGHAQLKELRQEHANGVEKEPASIIAGVTFKGKYAPLNTMTLTENSYNNGFGIFNVSPKPARASWQANYNVYKNHNGEAYCFVWRSYNDGFNNQIAADYANTGLVDSLRLSPGIFNYEMTLLKT